ncbi:MAG: ComF family protein [Aridibacter sp.]
MFQKFYDSLLTLAYPQSCNVCEKSVEKSSDGVVCRVCWEQTQIFRGDETLCDKCGRFLSDKPTDFKTFCHECDEHFYDAVRAVGKYEKGLAASILNLKREPVVAKYLQKLFVEAFQKTDFQNITKIIPVPLSKRRFLERGHNQAAVLSRILAKETGIILDEHSLIRTKHTPIHRAGMDKKGREMSVEKAFEVKREKLIKGEKILLVDDVFTSGATASMCAKELKKKGADKVYIFTIARTV